MASNCFYPSVTMDLARLGVKVKLSTRTPSERIWTSPTRALHRPNGKACRTPWIRYHLSLVNEEIDAAFRLIIVLRIPPQKVSVFYNAEAELTAHTDKLQHCPHGIWTLLLQLRFDYRQLLQRFEGRLFDDLLPGSSVSPGSAVRLATALAMQGNTSLHTALNRLDDHIFQQARPTQRSLNSINFHVPILILGFHDLVSKHIIRSL
mmetsp:Transcript_85013/g.189818  ORF Transcript_85013/g.189818 Transcript_85013/m.189818 type:complete len:206 (+) Transcript_85013:3-620(+)